MFSLLTPIAVLGFVSSTLGAVYITNPTAATTFTAGEKATISWKDDGAKPALKDFGPTIVSIYAGNAIQQTELLQIGNIDVSNSASVEFTPPPGFGPNSNEYFVRFQSVYLKDEKMPQYPALAFSAKFTMAGMTGAFSPEVQAQIDGQSTAPVGGDAAPTGSGSSGSASKTPSATANNAAASSPADDNDGAFSTSAAKMGVVGAVGVVVASIML